MQAAPKIVGLTGGIGSGKSRTREIFQQLGVPELDADPVAREIHQNPAHPALEQIARFFPQAITLDGRLSRGSLREFFARDVAANETMVPWTTDAPGRKRALQLYGSVGVT